jgi:hypothetical protein
MKRRRYVFLLLLAGLLLAGCAPRAHTPRIDPAWGRASLVGAAAHSDRVGLAAAPDGNYVALAYPVRPPAGAEDFLHLLVLDGRGDTLIDQDFEPSFVDIQDVQLLLATTGELHLYWLAGARSERALWRAQLPPMEAPSISILQPEQVSPAGVAVRWYRAELLPDGRPLVLWSDADACVQGRLDGGAPSECLLTGVFGVDYQLDPFGVAHVTWTRQETASRLVLNHGLLTPDSWAFEDRRPVSMVIIPGGASPDAINGPVISLGDGYDYVSWTQEITTMFGTTQQQRYVAVPQGDRQGGLPTIRLLESEQVQLLAAFPPPAEPAHGSFPYQQLVVPGPESQRGTTVSGAPAALSGRGEESALVTSGLYYTRSREGFQPTIIYLRDGVVLGYQVLTWTDRPSINAVVAADGSNNLYVAWNDATGESYHYPIYLATTAPALRAAWQGLTYQDILSIAVDLLNRVTSGVFLIPLTLIWLLVPFVWILAAVIVSHGELYGNQGRVVLIGALWIYWLSKYLFSQQILATLPSLAYLPPTVATLAVYLVPVFLLGLSCALAWLVYYRRTPDDEFSAMRAYLITAGIDWVLSLVIYATGYFE